MWRKIHSNRDPRDTLYSELQKEFRPWFLAARRSALSLLASRPRFFFYTMVSLLLASAVLSFTVFRHREEPVHVAVKKPVNPVTDGFSRIIAATGRLKETLDLRHVVDSLSRKNTLSAQDSLVLDSALNRLRQIDKP
jgi:hypothetical protein